MNSNQGARRFALSERYSRLAFFVFGIGAIMTLLGSVRSFR